MVDKANESWDVIPFVGAGGRDSVETCTGSYVACFRGFISLRVFTVFLAQFNIWRKLAAVCIHTGLCKW